MTSGDIKHTMIYKQYIMKIDKLQSIFILYLFISNWVNSIINECHRMCIKYSDPNQTPLWNLLSVYWVSTNKFLYSSTVTSKTSQDQKQTIILYYRSKCFYLTAGPLKVDCYQPKPFFISQDQWSSNFIIPVKLINRKFPTTSGIPNND